MENELLKQIWKYVSQFDFVVIFTSKDVGIKKGLLLCLASKDYLFYCKDKDSFILTESGLAVAKQ